jgi:hypothetical protein
LSIDVHPPGREPSPERLWLSEGGLPFSPVADEAELAAVAFLARYSGRTLDAYRHDLRSFFQWTADHGVETLAATRAHIELYRMSMEQRGLAASTIDRRLSTVCGYYRFVHIDGRIPANPPSVPATRRTHASRRSPMTSSPPTPATPASSPSASVCTMPTSDVGSDRQ